MIFRKDSQRSNFAFGSVEAVSLNPKRRKRKLTTVIPQEIQIGKLGEKAELTVGSESLPPTKAPRMNAKPAIAER